MSNLCAGLDCVPSLLTRGEVYREIGGCCVWVCGIGFVDIHGDWIMIDVEAVQLLSGLFNGMAGFEKGEGCIAVVT